MTPRPPAGPLPKPMDPAFQKSFLRDYPRGKTEAVLALFGKHPAWNDHMDDLGLSTPSLRTCKKLLYLQGIAANAARQQSTGAEVTSYRHLLLWHRGSEAILLRLIESEDGRGRGYFPLVGAVHFVSASLQDALRVSLPALRTFTGNCNRLGSRHAVLEEHRHAQARIREDFRHLPHSGPVPVEAASAAEIDAVRQVLAMPGEFARLRLPVARYDVSQSLATLASACPGEQGPILIVQGDADPFITLCRGQPDKADFWFLREP